MAELSIWRAVLIDTASYKLSKMGPYCGRKASSLLLHFIWRLEICTKYNMCKSQDYFSSSDKKQTNMSRNVKANDLAFFSGRVLRLHSSHVITLLILTSVILRQCFSVCCLDFEADPFNVVVLMATCSSSYLKEKIFHSRKHHHKIPLAQFGSCVHS